MGTTIRRSVNDTDPLVYELRDKLIYEDRSKAVTLTGKTVHITMANSYTDVPEVDASRQFENLTARDQYYAANPDELIDGLITTYVDGDAVTCMIWRDGQWYSDYWVIVDDKACNIVDAAKGYISYAFTAEEVCRAGMFHIYFRVVTYDDPEEGDPVAISTVKYPKGDSLWIHLIDIFTE